MNLKKYQVAAVRKLIERGSSLLLSNSPSKLVFQAPTGSGKTIMMAEFLSNLLTTPSLANTDFCVIWTAPRKLHLQSKQKLESYYSENQEFVSSEFHELSNLFLEQNEILFLNWESINKSEKNLIVVENESEFYLDKILQNTRDMGRLILLVIDESHHGATTQISKQLINDMSPNLTIEVSATPTLESPDEIVKISLDEVKLEGMIKKTISLNEGFLNALQDDRISSELSDGEDHFVLEKALVKRQKLVDEYKKIQSHINPLLLIQLPDRKSGNEEALKSNIISILQNDFDITLSNGKLAIYLSEEKENLENIAKSDSAVEVLIFKQAIALGWDCPRAQILVLFRENKSLTFSIQTMGRIMRMPEPEIGHYSNEELNKAYVYTNLDNLSIDQDLGNSYLTIYTSHRAKSFKDINLKSVYRLRQRERTRLDSSFVKIFMDAASEMKLTEKITIKNQNVQHNFITDYVAESVDSLNDLQVVGNQTATVQNVQDLQNLFDFFVRKNLEPFYPEERSIGRLKESLYEFFLMELNMDYSEEQESIINIVLSESNRQHFVNTIDKAKDSYSQIAAQRESELSIVQEWNVPLSLAYTGEQVSVETEKSIMEPFYTDLKYRTEQAFQKYLEKSEHVVWWFKNGDRDATFFAVPYIEDGVSKPFYVDFIVQLTNGKIGLYDTKRGSTVTLAKEKSDGLLAYIASTENCVGGIVDNTKENFDGRWMIYPGKGVDLIANDFQNWNLLELQ